MRFPSSLTIWLAAAAFGGAAIAEPCRMEIVEKGTGWPVPLVELRTTHGLRFVSDNAGLIACDAPELFGRETWFEVLGHGYEAPADGFGMQGVRLRPRPGQTLRVEVERKIIARRLGRITGAGIFAESQKLGLESEWKEAGVFGCDSVQNAVHRGRLFWAWGDTLLAGYPLGLFHGTSATTALPPLADPVPPVRLPLEYFRDAQGAPRNVAQMPGEGPTWITGYVSLADGAKPPRLAASYVKIRGHLEAYQSGLCVWNDETGVFENRKVLWTKTSAAPTQPPLPDGHPAWWKDEAGREWVYFGNPLPALRCPASFAAWQDPATWEVLKPQPSLESAEGKPVVPHSGSISWNDFRRRWVAVFTEKNGKPSAFGEVWYSEADAPIGPWGKAVKVLSHRNYTFYNPRLHPEWTPAGSPVLLFEGTFTAEFADHPQVSPRANYNQVLYRLDLDDPALAAARSEKTALR